MCHYNRKNALKFLTLLDLYDIIISYFIKERSILRDIKKMGVFKDLINNKDLNLELELSEKASKLSKENVQFIISVIDLLEKDKEDINK